MNYLRKRFRICAIWLFLLLLTLSMEWTAISKKTSVEATSTSVNGLRQHFEIKFWKETAYQQAALLNRVSLSSLRTDFRKKGTNLFFDRSGYAFDVNKRQTGENQKTDNSLSIELYPKKCQKKKSCRNRCQSVTVISESENYDCKCDAFCSFFKDCCADYHRYCRGTQLFSARLDQNVLSCSKDSMWMINKCPRDWKDNGISSKCENLALLKGNNVRRHIPVMAKNNLIFKNEYCARCNKARVLEYFGLKIMCSVVPPSSITVERKVSFALKYCGKESVAIFKKEHQHGRKCFPDMIQSCPEGHPGQKNCTGSLVGLVSYDYVDYKNVWCSSCWKVPLKSLRCGPFISPTQITVIDKDVSALPVVPFSVAIDLSSGSHSAYVFPSCPKGEVYDTRLEICSLGLASLPKQFIQDEYLVVVWLSSNNNSAVSKITSDDFIFSLARLFKLRNSQISNVIIKAKRQFYVIRFNLVLTNEQMLTLAKENYREQTAQKQGSQLVSKLWMTGERFSLRKLLFFSEEFVISLMNMSLTVFKTTSRQLACVKKVVFTAEQYELFENEKYYVNSTGKMYSRSDVFIELDTGRLIVCEETVFSNCDNYKILLKFNEYVMFDNLTVFYNRTKTTYEFGEYDLVNESVVICVTSDTSRSFHKAIRPHELLKYLTLCTFLISLVCLFLIILTYAIFSELRHLPGKNILNLSVPLFLAQLLWLATVPLYQTPVVCHVTAVAEHYLFIVSFLAMAVIAYYTNSIFSSKDVSRNLSEANNNRMFYKYSAVVWGIPAIFVVTCALLDYQGVYDVYVNDQMQVCWFVSGEAQEYLFVLPVGLILLFNVILFTHTVVTIHRQRRETSLVTRSSHVKEKTMFWVYLKLSTLMGFTWLFGLLDVLVDSNPVFSYLFVIFASLQGFYMAIAFLFTERVWTLYKRRSKTNRNSENQATSHKSNLMKYRDIKGTRL